MSTDQHNQPPPDIWQKAKEALAFYFSLLNPSQTKLLIALSVVAGVTAGLAATLFEITISAISSSTYGKFDIEGDLLSRIWILFLPAIGGLLAGYVINRFSKDAQGQGVAEVIYALRKNKAIIPIRTVLTKAVASALTIGTGGSAGPEGPVVQIGGGVGSIVGRLVGLTPNTLRVLVAAGAAGGISAVFNAPIAGVLFAMEVLLRDFVVNAFSLVVLSSVSASVTAHLLLGDQIFLKTPGFSMHGSYELILYGIMGIGVGLASQVFVQVFIQIEGSFERRKKIPDHIKPMIGGLVVGLLGWIFPPILGSGIEFLTSIVRGDLLISQFTILIFMGLMLSKILATSFTLGSGGSGGLLTPSFFIGGITGAIFGVVYQTWIPGIDNYGPYALVGMVAFFSAVSRAPLTAIILLLELTHNQQVIMPGMVGCVLATFVAQRLSPHSYELLRLTKKGISIDDIEIKENLPDIDVGSTMIKNVETINDTMTIPELQRFIETNRHTGFPVISEGGDLKGLLTYTELYNAFSTKKDFTNLTVKDIMRKQVKTITADVSLKRALRIMRESGQDRVPVVEKQNPTKVIGLVTRTQIIEAFKGS